MKIVLLLFLIIFLGCSKEKEKATVEKPTENNGISVNKKTEHETVPNTIPAQKTGDIADFIPAGWKKILETKGDLNGDGIQDVIIVIEEENPKNIISATESSRELNRNTRNLLVLFQDNSNKYYLAGQNRQDFIPPPNGENDCLADPLLENGGISAVKGGFKVYLVYWYACGSWFVNRANYHFRFQKGKFMLIGFDHKEYHRSSREMESASINLLTGKKSETTGLNEFEEGNPVTEWFKFNRKPIPLEKVSDETYFELLEIER